MIFSNEKNNMKVEIWADFACPFCYIGKRRFEQALSRLPFRDHVQVVYRSFELDPHAPKQVPYDVYDMLSKKFGMSRQQAITGNENLKSQAAAVGLEFHFEGLVLTNTFDAHRLRHYAKQHGKDLVISELLYRAYFNENKNVSDYDTLADLATEAGLNREDTLTMLFGTQFSELVRKEEADSRILGITGVPFYYIDRKFALSGAQSEEMFLSALQEAWNEQNRDDVSSSSENCVDGTCYIK
ncbi:DsbA family oxidoreductase [Paenibacillus spongiae]|uniref:DsbA family oxidoreductase n=1 Tax=Paenibacillus spongiae TaxID=2909671 RepID=A0ABY5S165_9BACL|nr:DsbA family oxidoreductase [Paenibacillus spongiae]UVI27394.1 DsbA family oxidoreductase [Paenibacillus spongiae]